MNDIILIPHYSLLAKALKSGGKATLLYANKQPNKISPLGRNAILLGLLSSYHICKYHMVI